MFIYSSYERLLIKRFLFSKKTDGFISIFSWFSIIGITIGVGAIIIVMGVMNGFREELTSRLLGINGHLNIYSYDHEIDEESFNFFNDKNLDYKLLPLTQTQAFLVSNNFSKGILLRGYNKNNLLPDHFLFNKIIKGSIFGNNINEVVIGYALATQLGLKLNDKFKIIIPKADNTIFGNIPRFKTLSIVGIFNLGMYEYDSNYIFTHVSLANKLLMLDENSYNQIEIFIKDPNQIEFFQSNINKKINENNLYLYSTSWKQNNSALINALNVEKKCYVPNLNINYNSGFYEYYFRFNNFC